MGQTARFFLYPALPMRNRFRHSVLPGLLLLAAVLPLAAQNYTPLQRHNRLKVLSYNVRNAVGTDGRTDAARIGRVVRESGADVVAVQEVDSATARSGGRYVLDDIAREALMYATFGAAMPYDGGKYGIGVLSRERPLAVRRVPLPGSEEPRLLLVLEFDRYVQGCTHLSLVETDRLAALPVLRDEAARSGKPFILAGDWNDTIGSPLLRQLDADFRIATNPRAATFPADRPETCIDFIALYRPTSGGLVPVSSRVPAEKVASDHRPVLAELQFKTPAADLVYHAPYLQRPEPDGITVMFQTRAVSHCWVEYGTDTLHLQRARSLAGGQEVCHDIENRIRLEGLTPGATYYYRVCAQEIIDYRSYSKTFGETYKGPFHTFTLPTARTEDFTALILNDLHENAATIRAFAALARDIPHDFVIFNGDCLPEPVDRDYAVRHLHVLADAFDAADKPAFFVRGNHEIRNAYSAGMPSLFDQPGGRTYGAFSWGDTRFVLLDCGEDKPDDHWVYYGLNDFAGFRREQTAFLEREKASAAFRKAHRRVLVHHVPVWGNTDEYRPCTELWSPVLRKMPFDIDLAAHTHEYRYHPAGGGEGNPFPVVVGGGPSLEAATLLVLTKKGGDMWLRVLDTKGRELRRIDL